MNAKAAKIITHILLILMSFMAVSPLYWMIVSSLKGPAEIFGYDIIAKSPTLVNYVEAFTAKPLLKMLFNSIIISVGTAFFQIVLAVLFAYAFTRWEFKGKTLVYGLISIIWLVPIQAIMVPNYVNIVRIGLNNTVLAIILPHCCSVFANITMYQNFNSMPKALIDAARLDGSNELKILCDIVLPNMKSSISAVAIVQVISAWNDYLWPALIARSDEIAPIQIGLKSFTGGDGNMWGAVMAASTISTIPILIIYLFMSSKIIDSFMKGGIK